MSWRAAPVGEFTVTVVSAGTADCPVIAVPTSVGYGASLDGITALLAMHASCAAGITVVNIDSGFGAAMAAHRIARDPVIPATAGSATSGTQMTISSGSPARKPKPNR